MRSAAHHAADDDWIVVSNSNAPTHTHKAAAPAASPASAALPAMSAPARAAPTSAASASSAGAPPRRVAQSIVSSEVALAPGNSLVVGSTPEVPLVYTNEVYVAAHDSNQWLLKSPYVIINECFVFRIKTHAAMTVDTVGLSSIQRKAVRVNLAERTSIAPWFLPPNGSADLVSMRLEVEIVGTKRATIAAVDLAPAMIKSFDGHVFTRGQIFCKEFAGTPLQFTVVYAEAGVPVSEQNSKLAKAQESKAAEDGEASDEEVEEGVITREVTQGMISSRTRLELQAPPSKFLTFKAEEKRAGAGILNPKFRFADMGIGGLDAEFGMIFRRSFASRLFPPEITKKLGIRHVKGMLLYGPPGTGKTLIARQIGKILATKEPKVVNGPEILNKFVGASEENIRNLFKEAEEDTIANGDNAELHIIIFDEIDAICKARGRGGDSTGVHDTVVNQLLSKIDGVNALNNILVIGMTNRKDMIDSALLRPGRLEVHIEIGLPDEKGRVQIFNIHLSQMRSNGMLAEEVTSEYLASQTKNFSGAEIEGLVKSASSFALYASIDIKKTGAKPVDVSGKNIVVRLEHFQRALDEVKAAFGVDEDELKMYLRSDLLDYGAEYQKIITTCKTLVNQVRTSKATPLLSLLLEGPNGSGKTSIAAKLAVDSGFPYVKVISPEQFVGYHESKKCSDITKIFEDAYKSPLSLIILDSIERLLEYVAVGPRFSQAVLQTLLVLVNRIPPNANRKLMIIGTSSRASLLESLEITQAFNVVQAIPALSHASQVAAVLSALDLADKKTVTSIALSCYLPIPIKQLLMVAEMAKQEVPVTPERFEECLQACGFDSGSASTLRASSSSSSKSNNLSFYTASASSSTAKKRRDASDEEDD